MREPNWETVFLPFYYLLGVVAGLVLLLGDIPASAPSWTVRLFGGILLAMCSFFVIREIREWLRFFRSL